MKNIRSILTVLVLLFSISTVAIYVSCKTDKCKDIACLNGGACNDGKCVCPTGYTGTYCETPPPVDPCASVTCQNGGTCNSGTCTCPTGTTGTYCETIYREQYDNGYLGNGTEDGTLAYINWTMNFAISGTDLTKMTLTMKDNTGYVMFTTFQITLTSFSATGSTFTITPVTVAGGSYTGSGTVNGSVATLTLNTLVGSTTVVSAFTNMNRI